MIFSENRYPLFGIMLVQLEPFAPAKRQKSSPSRIPAMRAAVLLTVWLLGLSQASAHADDKFLLCPFLGFGHCVPLTDTAMQDRAMSTEDRQMIAKLQRLSRTPDRALLEDIAQSFDAPQQPYASRGMSALWFPDRQDDCFACGLHLLLHKGNLVQINWGMKGKFMLIWNDPPAPPQAK
jgi:hypothetical protein